MQVMTSFIRYLLSKLMISFNWHPGHTRSASARRREGVRIDAQPKARYVLYPLMLCQMHDNNSMRRCLIVVRMAF